MAGESDDLIRRAALQAQTVPVDTSGPKRRTWEGYADDYRALTEQLVEFSNRQQDLLQAQAQLEEQLKEKERVIERLKARRAKDLERLAEVSRTRDLLERRSSAQMAKVAAAISKIDERNRQFAAQGSGGAVAIQTLALAAPAPAGMASANAPEQALAILLPFAPLSTAGNWFSRVLRRLWWRRTLRNARQAHRAGGLAQAELLLRAALLIRESPSLWMQLGHLLREQKQFHAAYEAYDRVLQADPKNGEAWFLAGYCCEMAGTKDHAVRCYDQALAYDSSLAERYDHLRGYHARLAG